MDLSAVHRKISIESSFYDHLDVVFNQYPLEFFNDVVLYGRSFAEEILDKNRYELFDPMVSDRSCQLRAIWLSCFQKSKKKSANLTEEDFLIFGLARFLCESAISAEYNIIGSVPLKTCSSYWPEDILRLKNAVIRRHFLGEAKSLLSERILLDMRKWLENVKYEDLLIGMFPANIKKCYSELISILKKPPHSSYSEVQIPVVHFFPGFVAVMTLAAYFQVTLSIIFRKVTRDSRSILSCSDSHITHFSFDKQSKSFKEILPAKKNNAVNNNLSLTPVIVFSGHSYIDKLFNKQINPYSALPSLNALLNKNVSIMDYIYAIMATHAALPGERRDDDWKIEEAPELSKITHQYLEFAKSVGLSVHDTVTRIYNESQGGGFNNLVIPETPFEITHIYNNSLKNLM